MKNSFLIAALILLSSPLLAQPDWNTMGNSPVLGSWLGTFNNQPLNIKTNNLMRATFTTGNAFGTGSTQGDGLRIFDTSGGPGHLDLWTSSSTQTHIRWNGSGTIQGMNSRLEM